MDEQVLNELLECSVCLERLNHTSKVLPCQHTFCRRCLDEIVSTKHELRCPECRNLVQENVEDLPTNILLVRLLEGLKQHNTAVVANHRSRSPGRKNDISSGTGSQPGSRQTRQSQIGSQPCARALFNYDAKDNGDLSFKKGDSILLRKQIDENWYHGELNGQHGFFPASYVQVIVPLPATLPQCKALYDFEMKDEKEKDCLCFKKDEVLTVIRRVDDNWLEGKKGERIGIFPISFVELNEPAKNLVNGKNGNTPALSIQQPLERHGGDGEAMPSLLQGLPPSSSAQQLLHQQKRHSYTDASSRNSPPVQQHRHSLELGSNTNLAAASASAVSSTEASSASMSGTAVLTNSNASISTSQSPGDMTNKVVSTKSVMTNTNANNSTSRLSVDMTNKTVSTKSVMTNTNGSNSTSHMPCEMNNKSVATKSTSTTQNGQIWHSPVQGVNSVSSAYTNIPVPFTVSQNTPIYIAMYNYRPQKEDELELKKGDYYTVSEKCQDGWFKGKCLKTGQIGVFPGNYVQVVRSQCAHKSVVKNGNNQTHAIHASTSPNLSTYVPLPSRPKTSPGRSKSMDRGDRDKGPPVVPRGQRGTHMSPSHSAKGANQGRPGNDSVNITKSGQQGSGFVPTKSTGQQTNLTSRSMSPSQVSAGVSSQDERHLAQMGQKSSSSSISSTSSSSSASPVWKHSMSACSNITPPNVVVGATGEITPANPPKEKKEKKEKEKLSLVKRLTSGKSKKSKFSTDSEGASLNDSSIAHARSGSFPSDPTVTSLAESSHHKKSGSFDATSSSSSSHKPSRPKPPIREKHRCIVPYPPQGEIELELKIGDIVYVHKKREDGWFKGTLQRTGKTGLFPGSFVEKCD
ncbi:hypothetical protein CHS0354_001145 [Potamilus streckersoni]|uniref:RING-type E3 ubiquitin transferase n=1 Tax=Potamilus streckersoni TaxID=2493646 RepID=A0AAE0VGE0_9BIVA|nr:hypothetical protein CHS0354_001145 [Potamilus streckersoni]